MKIFKTIMNVFGIILASILSVVLTVVLITVPVVSCVSSFLQSDTLHKVVKELDYSKLIGDAMASAGADEMSEILGKFMETNAAGEIIDLYVNDLFSAVEGESSKAGLTMDAMMNIVENNMDEILEVMNPYVNPDGLFSEEEVSAYISMAIEIEGGNIITMLPKAEDIGLVASEGNQNSQKDIVIQGISSLRSKELLTTVIIFAAILSVLVLLLRVMRFKGFMWIGVVYVIATAVTLVEAWMVNSSFITQSLAGEIGQYSTIVDTILPILSVELLKVAVVLALVAIVSIAVFVVGRIYYKKRNVKKQDEPEALPA